MSVSVDYDAAWAAWDTEKHAGCSGFRYVPGASVVQCCDCLTYIDVTEVAEVADA